MHKKSFILISLFFLIGCSTPPLVKEKAATILKEKCYDYFIDNGMFSYQYFAHQVRPKVVFAYAEDSHGYACSFAAHLHVADPTWENIESMAVAKCEDNKLSNNSPVKAPCKIFARNNDIVWGNNEKINLQ